MVQWKENHHFSRAVRNCVFYQLNRVYTCSLLYRKIIVVQFWDWPSFTLPERNQPSRNNVVTMRHQNKEVVPDRVRDLLIVVEIFMFGKNCTRLPMRPSFKERSKHYLFKSRHHMLELTSSFAKELAIFRRHWDAHDAYFICIRVLSIGFVSISCLYAFRIQFDTISWTCQLTCNRKSNASLSSSWFYAVIWESRWDTRPPDRGKYSSYSGRHM